VVVVLAVLVAETMIVRVWGRACPWPMEPVLSLGEQANGLERACVGEPLRRPGLGCVVEARVGEPLRRRPGDLGCVVEARLRAQQRAFGLGLTFVV
jgi:hypothetical protein